MQASRKQPSRNKDRRFVAQLDALAAGFHDYVPKPIDPERFVQQLEDYLPRRLRVERPPQD